MSFETFLVNALSPLTKKISPALGRLYLLERYETDYNIFNHDTAKDDSLALMLMHNAENPNIHSLFRKRLVEYREREVLRLYGLNFQEFISQPRHRLEEMLSACEVAQKEEHQREQARLAQLENEKNK